MPLKAIFKTEIAFTNVLTSTIIQTNHLKFFTLMLKFKTIILLNRSIQKSMDK